MGAVSERRRRRQRRLVAGINITPLTDVALVLLVVFMMTATFLGTEGDVDVRLPGAASATAREDVGAILVLVRPDGVVSIDGQAVSRELLVAAFRERARVGGAKQVVVRGDRACRYEDVFAVMDAARVAGLHEIALATQTAAPSPGGEVTSP